MLPSFHTYIWCAEVNYLPAFWPCYSIPAPIGDAASSATTHFAAASGGTTEGSLSLSQHQAGQQPGLSLSSPRSCLQQVGSAASVIKWKCWWKCILGLRSVHNLVKMVSFCVVKKKNGLRRVGHKQEAWCLFTPHYCLLRLSTYSTEL